MKTKQKPAILEVPMHKGQPRLRWLANMETFWRMPDMAKMYLVSVNKAYSKESFEKQLQLAMHLYHKRRMGSTWFSFHWILESELKPEMVVIEPLNYKFDPEKRKRDKERGEDTSVGVLRVDLLSVHKLSTLLQYNQFITTLRMKDAKAVISRGL